MGRTVGILAYGSLIANPGSEIAPAIVDRREVMTPFYVEFARTSKERCGAPTLVPVKEGGAAVPATLLVLNVSEDEAAHRLYRREINQVGSKKQYKLTAKPGPNTVIIRRLEDFEEMHTVLYTEIQANIPALTAKRLAALAIQSARGLDDDRDGISYLIAAKTAGITTLLSAAYEEEIKKELHAASLEEALRTARNLGKQ